MSASPRRKYAAVISLLAAALSLTGCPWRTGTSAPVAQSQTVRERMESIIAHLDSAEYAAAAPWEEHAVLVYRLAQGRNPTPIEFAILEGLREDPAVSRSEMLGLALAGGKTSVDMADCERFVTRFDASSFQADADVKAAARELTRVKKADIAKTLDLTESEARKALEILDGAFRKGEPGVEYQIYFGFLHAHSHLSLDADPEGTPMEAYTFARDQGGLDFFSLTDHAEFLVIWPWGGKWQRLRNAAEATYEPGRYVTFWGFEWSNPLLGHVSVINTEDFTHTLRTFRMAALYEWIAARPEALATFNHPGDYDFIGLEFLHFYPYQRAVAQMVGIELWNTDRSFDVYHYAGSWDSELSFFDVGIQNGWRLGALGAQDNHRRDWGTRNDFRTGVLATELTREAILDAYENRRFYATEDKDLFLDFRASGYPMGSMLTGAAREFTVTASDGSDDTFTQVRLFRNGALLETRPVSGASISVTFADPAPTAHDYYYVIVSQADDNDNNGRNDEAISSPIWIEE